MWSMQERSVDTDKELEECVTQKTQEEAHANIVLYENYHEEDVEDHDEEWIMQSRPTESDVDNQESNDEDIEYSYEEENNTHEETTNDWPLVEPNVDNDEGKGKNHQEEENC